MNNSSALSIERELHVEAKFVRRSKLQRPKFRSDSQVVRELKAAELNGDVGNHRNLVWSLLTGVPFVPFVSSAMASANLAVAKASLSATLFRPDPKPCSRDDIDHFFSLLTTTVTQCSPANVQV